MADAGRRRCEPAQLNNDAVLLPLADAHSEAAEAYKTLYQRPLVQDLHAATEGWYQKTLVYIVRESFELRVHVAKPWIQLQRDVDV